MRAVFSKILPNLNKQQQSHNKLGTIIKTENVNQVEQQYKFMENQQQSPNLSLDQNQSEAIRVKGNKIAKDLLTELKMTVNNISKGKKVRKPSLAIILVGNNPGSISYVTRKMKACKRVGILPELFHFSDKIKKSTLTSFVHQLNQQPDIDSILCQLPLPSHLPKLEIINAIDKKKDVDCLQNIVNFPQMQMSFQTSTNLPCTPNAILHILDHHNIPLEGKQAVILGKGLLVGYPLTVMLLQRFCTVTTLDEHTKNIEQYIRKADLLISAAGVRHLVKGEWIKEGAAVIDVGANKPIQGVDQNKKIIGDVEFEAACLRAGLITPVPGGVGPVTVSMLLKNVVTTWKQNITSQF